MGLTNECNTPNIIAFTSNLEDENPFFVGFMGNCPMFGHVDVLGGIVSTNVKQYMIGEDTFGA
jgi:hypothetical protein